MKLLAWARLQGPLGALGDDYRHADLVMRTSMLGKPGQDRRLAGFLPPWRLPSDYLVWGIDLGPDPPTSEEFTTDE